MKDLVRLIRSLNSNERRFVHEFELSSKSRQRLNLFSRIVEGRIVTNQDAIDQIYPGKLRAASSLCHLKKKLQEDILNVLIILVPDNTPGKSNQHEIQCEKQLLQSEILYSKGLEKESRELLERTMILADKYDFPQIKLASYFKLTSHVPNRSRQGLHVHFQQCIRGYQELVAAKSAFYSEKFKGPLESEDIVQKHGVNIRSIFWKKMTKIRRLYRHKQYKKASSEAHALQQTIVEFHSPHNEAKLFQLLSDIYMQLADFEQSIHYARESLRLLPSGCSEYLDCVESVFRGYLHSDHFQGAASVIPVDELNDKGEDACNKWRLLCASLKFRQCEYLKAYELLNTWECRHTSDVKWHFSHRFLELLTIIELGDFEWYESRLECIRKKIGNSRQNIPKRIDTLYRLCHGLLRYDFNFKYLLIEETERFHMLKNSLEHRWDPLGFEIINVSDWMISKAGKFNSLSL